MKTKVKLALSLVTLFVGCTTMPIPAQQVDLVSLQKNTVVLHTADGVTCSGFVKGGTHTIVTAAHCKGDGIAADFGDGTLHPLKTVAVGDEDWNKGPDLMTLTSDDMTVPWPKGIPFCEFVPYYGQDIVLMGAPLGVDHTMTFGKVSKPSQEFLGRSFTGIDAKMLPGNSGGPAIDIQQQCVVGVADFIQLQNPKFPVAYGNSFITPIKQIEELNG